MKKVAVFFNLQPGEAPQVLLLFLLSFCLGLVNFFTLTTASTLFLINFSAAQLPLVDIGLVLVMPLLGLVYDRLGQRLPLRSLLLGSVGVLFISLIGFYLLLRFSGARWPLLALSIWYWQIFSMSNVTFWTMAGHLFDVRQGKRLFSLVGSGMMVAAIMGGLSVTSLAALIGTRNLLLVAVVGGLGALLALLLLMRQYGSQLTERPSHETADMATTTRPKQRWWHNRYIVLVLVIVLLSEVSYNLLDYAFMGFTELRYPGEAELASFLGRFFGLMAFLTLVSQVALTGRFLTRFGIKISLLVLPVAVAFFAVAAAITGLAGLPLAWVFALTMAAALSDGLVRDSIFRSSLQTLYQPLPQRQQGQVLSLAESFVMPLAAGLTATTVLLLRRVITLPPLHLIVGLVGATAVWFAVSRILGGRAYPDALRKALVQRRLEDADLALGDASTIEVLRQSLRQSDAGVVIYALYRLKEGAPQLLAEELPLLLNHPVAEVRLEALGLLAEEKIVVAGTAVRHTIETEPDSIIKGAALRTLAALQEAEAVALLATYLGDENAAVQRGAMVGLLRWGGIEGVLQAGERLLTMVRSTQVAQRMVAAEVLGEVGNRDFYTPLLPLLADEADKVRRVAVAAAMQIGNPHLWPLLVDNLRVATVRGLAASVLVAGGEAVLPVLQAAFADASLRRYVPLVYGRIGGAAVQSDLFAAIDVDDEVTRTEVLRALSQCRFQANGAQVAVVRQQLEAEAKAAAWLVAALYILQDDGRLLLLSKSLAEQLLQSQARLFWLLSFLYGTAVLEAQTNLAQVASEKHAYALEVLDTLLPQTLKPLLLPLLQPLQLMQLDEQVRQLTATDELPIWDQMDCLQMILAEGNGRFSAWTRACALYAVGLCAMLDLRPLVVAQIDEAGIVGQTAVWVNERLFANHANQPASLKAKPEPLTTLEQVAFLSNIDLFSHIPLETLVAVTQVAETVYFAPGTTFIQQGLLEDSLYVIVSGEVDIVIDQQVVTRRIAGEVIGELAVLGRRPRMASCVAHTMITVLKIDQSNFNTLLTENVTLAQGIIKVLLQKIDQATQRAIVGEKR